MTKKFVREEWEERLFTDIKSGKPCANEETLDLYQSFEDRIEKLDSQYEKFSSRMALLLQPYNSMYCESKEYVDEFMIEKDILKKNISSFEDRIEELEKNNNFPEINGTIDELRTYIQVNYQKLAQRIAGLEAKEEFYDSNFMSNEEFIKMVADKVKDIVLNHFTLQFKELTEKVNRHHDEVCENAAKNFTKYSTFEKLISSLENKIMDLEINLTQTQKSLYSMIMEIRAHLAMTTGFPTASEDIRYQAEKSLPKISESESEFYIQAAEKKIQAELIREQTIEGDLRIESKDNNPSLIDGYKDVYDFFEEMIIRSEFPAGSYLLVSQKIFGDFWKFTNNHESPSPSQHLYTCQQGEKFYIRFEQFKHFIDEISAMFYARDGKKTLYQMDEWVKFYEKKDPAEKENK